MKSTEIGPVRRTDHWNVPFPAVREAISNALTHADYSQRGAPIRISFFNDRIELENPGLLPFGLTIEEILRGVSKLRNRVIGRVFRELGLIEQWGSGVQRMLATCRDMGIRDPYFEEIATHFRVTIYTTAEKKPRLDKVESKIMKALKQSDAGISTQEIARIIKLSTRSTSTHLRKLVLKGMVVVVGRNDRDPRRRYFPAN